MAPRSGIKRIGVLTGGGDCPGLNAVIRAVVKTGLIEHHCEAYGILDGYEGLINDRIVPLGYEDVSGILAVGGTIIGTSNTAHPFEYVREGEDPSTARDVSERCVKNFEKARLDVLVCIGGDGSLSIAHQLAQKGIPVVGVPKTIDNDLYGTDVTFGFDTAVQIVSDAVDRLHTTAMSHHRAMVIETMGRYAGWLALVGGMAGGGDVILIPEIPYGMERVCEAVEERSRLGKRFSIIVVSEGAKIKGEEEVLASTRLDEFGHVQLGGIGQVLGKLIEKKTGYDTRVTVLGHIQRGGKPTAHDRVLATRYGVAAMDAVHCGHYGTMVALQGKEVVEVPLKVVSEGIKVVDERLYEITKTFWG